MSNLIPINKDDCIVAKATPELRWVVSEDDTHETAILQQLYLLLFNDGTNNTEWRNVPTVAVKD